MNNVVYKSVGSFTLNNDYGLKLQFRFIVIDNLSKISQCHLTLKFNDGRFRSRFITTEEMEDIALAISKIYARFKMGTPEEVQGEFFMINENSGLNYSISAENYNGLNFKMKVKAENYYYEFDITNHLETFKLFSKTEAVIFQNHLNRR